MPRTTRSFDIEDTIGVSAPAGRAITTDAPSGHGRRALSVPAAIAGGVLVCALAFGASLGSMSPTSGDGEGAPGGAAGSTGPGGAAAGGALLGWDGYDGTFDDPVNPGGEGEPGVETDEPSDAPDESAEPTEKPKPTDKPKASEKPDPTKKPEPTEKPKPTDGPMGLELDIKEGAVFIAWSACGVDGADYYKVVRSSDETVKWPAGDDDTVVAVVEVGAKTKAWDEHAPAGKKAWYRVFCVRATDDGYKVVRSTETKRITTPEEEPAPEPSAMWLEATVDGASVVLSWEACDSDGFSHYRILRKVDGVATVIAEVESHDTTTFVDDDVEPGLTYRYLVQSKGHIGDDWVLLGTTEWVTVTVE